MSTKPRKIERAARRLIREITARSESRHPLAYTIPWKEARLLMLALENT